MKLYTQFKRTHININPTAFQDIKAFRQVVHPWPWEIRGSYSDKCPWLNALLESSGAQGVHTAVFTRVGALRELLSPDCLDLMSVLVPLGQHIKCIVEKTERDTLPMYIV